MEIVAELVRKDRVEHIAIPAVRGESACSQSVVELLTKPIALLTTIAQHCKFIRSHDSTLRLTS